MLKLKDSVTQSICKKCSANLVFLKKKKSSVRKKSSPIFSRQTPITRNKAEKIAKRDWKIAIGIIAGIALLILIVFAVIFSVIKGGQAYKTAESFIKNSREIKELIGDNMKFGFMPAGSVKVSGNRGRAKFNIKVKGNLGSTRVYISLIKNKGKWSVREARYIDSDGRIKRLIQRDREKRHFPTRTKDSSYLTKAYNMYRRRDYNEAIAEFNKAISLSPDNPDPYYWRAKSYMNLKMYDKAVLDLEKVIELDPERAEAYDNLGWIYGIKKEYDKSIDYLSKSIELNSDNAWAYYTRARSYYKKGDMDNALNDLEFACGLGHRQACKVYENLKKEM